MNTVKASTEKLSQEVKSNGFFLKENWLTKEDQEVIRNYIFDHKPIKGSKESLACSNNKSFLINFSKFNFRKIKISLFLNKIAKKLHLKKIAEGILNEKAKLVQIDFYYNKISNEPVLDWHCDNAYSGRNNVETFLHPEDYSIKFFFYLSDVSPDNGCLSYIPKSNIVTHALRKGIYEGAIKYSPYWRLKDLRNKDLNNDSLKYIEKLVDKKDLQIFLEHSDYALEHQNNLNKFDFSLKKGGAIIFNESGVHRGSKTKLSERLVLRFFYKKF